MFNLEKLIRPNIAKLSPYQSARDEFVGNAEVFLDANENPLGSVGFSKALYNRYPDPHQKLLKQKIALLNEVSEEEVFLGNGSDEIIDLIIRAFCEPLQDEVIILPPTYGMYEVCGRINNVEIRKVNLNDTFQIKVDEVLNEINRKTKVIFICSPNNPSGNTMNPKDIITIINNFNGIMVIDEAYIDFDSDKTQLPLIHKYPNLIVMQTLSKAWGLAGIRLGMGFANKQIIDVISKIKPPYNINYITQKAAIIALDNKEQKNNFVDTINNQRILLEKIIPKMPEIVKVFPTNANFILVRVNDADKLYNYFVSKGIVLRNRNNQHGCDGCLRISIGTAEENYKLLSTWNDYNKNFNPIIGKAIGVPDMLNEFTLIKKERKAQISRISKETNINIEINLDGTGFCIINTGVKFFDHMLEQISKHGKVDLLIETKGDLAVDEHHSIEDTAMVLGEAFRQALGDKKGIERYGFCLPMDDCLAQVALDFGGRSWLEWDAVFKRKKTGKIPTEMFFHFFKSFCDAAKCNLHIKAEGTNDHHKIEAIFKAFAKAVKMAIIKDPNNNEIPTTKGLL